MKIADLYIQVSTDEQADKGYSLRNQEELLRRYCEMRSTQIRKVIFEDHSAKTFDRPKWTAHLQDLRKHKGKSDMVLFTKLDRFSRNTSDAYQMIKTLRQLGVEPQAIEQPIDPSVPDTKIMLAIYMAVPEVENDRRAMNVFHGMRRAKKEGRWMGIAPVGYVNQIDTSGRKYITPKEPEAGIMKWVFEEISRGTFAADQIRRDANKKGLKCSRSAFWTAIRNPVYCGRINASKYKDEEPLLAQGRHEPLISEALFYDAQDVLCGRKRKEKTGTKMVTHENLPLRGFLICPRCSRLLTGSASKGRNNRYYIYHCVSLCSCRFKAEIANDLFEKKLKKYVPHPGMSELYVTALCKTFKNQTSHQQTSRRAILMQLDELNKRLKNALEMMADKQMDPEDYRQLKTACSAQIAELEVRLAAQAEKQVDIQTLLTKAVNTLGKLDELYANGTIIEKRKIIGSIFPEKLIFDGNEYRTSRLNEAVRLIYMLDKGFTEIKNRKDGETPLLSGEVVPTGIEPVSKV